MKLCIFSVYIVGMRFLTFLGIILVLVSCQEKQQTSTTVVEKSEHSIAQKHKELTRLEGKALKKVDNWDEYESVGNFLEKFKNISPNEALNNSKELNDLVKSLNDSIKPEFLKSSALDARLNLLLNESMRLYDMSSISAITHQEVNLQVEKLLEAYSSLNSKINTLVKQADLDSQVDDPKFSRILNLSNDSSSVNKTAKEETPEEKKLRKMQLSKEQRLKKRKANFKPIKKGEKHEKKKGN